MPLLRSYWPTTDYSPAGLGVLDLVTVPGRATRAFLRGCYRLEGERAQKALATATSGVVLATLLGVVAVIASLFALLFV